jgi:hypothetical protein
MTAPRLAFVPTLLSQLAHLFRLLVKAFMRTALLAPCVTGVVKITTFKRESTVLYLFMYVPFFYCTIANTFLA